MQHCQFASRGANICTKIVTSKMSTRLCHITAALGFFLIIAGLCQCAPPERLRDKRDTRDLPSNLFKPVDSGSSNTEPGLTARTRNSNSNDTPFVQTSGQAHVIQRVPEVFVVNRPSQDEVYREFNRFPTRSQGFSTRFGNPMSSNYNTDENLYGGQFGSGGSRNNFGQRSFPGSSFIGQTYGSPGSYRRPFSDGGDSSSSNYYRSESHSYNSDGSGPPQIEHSVYDSRLGHGINVKGF